jgi:F420-dependent oxidoreductase-like protein
MLVRVMVEPQQGATYGDLLRAARTAEDLGFEGFFRSDHYQHIGGGGGHPGPTDAWVTLAGLARETRRIRLGTLVSPATFRLPGPFAIAVATVDAMSGGRIDVGFGAGWFETEHVSYGIPFQSPAVRVARLAEYIEVVDGLWQTPANETFTFEGRYFRLQASPALPKPYQRPRPPMIVGGRGGPRSAAIAATFADEYNVSFSTLTNTHNAFEAVRRQPGGGRLAYSAGQSLYIGVDEKEAGRLAQRTGQSPEVIAETALFGNPNRIVDKVGRLADLGATRLYLQLPDLFDLDGLELFASDVLPQL